ncbi:uncharacterized protein LOC132800155 [Ziziphus jujuba]|uniref:Uncharacterized protein LOC132800155 n=1 Tax=Ziziphus jujuba TaxID=326968 RepID=A0ABM3ZXE5_ZIZJJ|nr:uncharacterized protein LOC132800155 [Ziziphus jujuba]
MIVLILKSQRMVEFNHIRPISLCNTIYKLISKLLATWIHPMLSHLISPNQAAFVPGCWIGENTILVNEIIHTIRRKRGAVGLVAFKFDMNKAYDWLNWEVLNEILLRFGFSGRVVSHLSQCFSNEKASILPNGSICGDVKVERGLRQGDPLSPYLYILFDEILSRMLHKLEFGGKIHGVSLGRTGPSFSHLFFADEILIFCRANREEVREVARCLQNFCDWTRQTVNKAKSGCFFSRNVQGSVKANIKEVLNIKELPKESKYLGNPLFLGKNKSRDFEELKNRVEAKLQDWKAKLLSQAGKLVLVKSAVMAMPIYTMSTHKLPLQWCRRIDSLASRFLWKGDVSKKVAFNATSWSKVCQPKSAGDLGIRKLADINLVLLCKLGWCLETKLELPKSKTVQAGSKADNILMRVVWTVTFMRCGQRTDSSWQWKGILSTRQILSKGLCFRVGKGNNVDIWEDPWVPYSPNFRPTPNPNLQVAPCLMVESLLSPSGGWNIPLLNQLFDQDSALWLALPWSIKWDLTHFTNLDDYMECIANPVGKLPMHQSDNATFILFAVSLLDATWKVRNKLLVEGNRSFLEEVKLIYRKVDEFSTTLGKDFASLGIVARDHEGRVLKFQVLKEKLDIPEAATVLKALHLDLSAGFYNIWCEDDAKTIILYLNNLDTSSIHWSAQVFINQIQDLRPLFNSVTFI